MFTVMKKYLYTVVRIWWLSQNAYNLNNLKFWRRVHFLNTKEREGDVRVDSFIRGVNDVLPI